MNKAMTALIKIYGTQSATAKALGVTRQQISYWTRGDRAVPRWWAAEIERITGGGIKAKRLRP